MPTEDKSRMRRALRAGQRGKGHCAPEPAVGVLAVLKDGRTRTAYRDAPHAPHPALAFPEAEALYLTLEPSPQVAKQLTAKRVVIGVDDPRWRGRARRALAKRCEVVAGVLAAECAALDEAYFFAVREGRPFVVLKSAMTLDGRIATRTGDSQWITGPEARAFGHRLRDRSDAIVVGMGTVRADDPALTARFDGARDPLRVVLDARLTIDLQSQLVRTALTTPTLVVTSRRASKKKVEALEGTGVEVLRLPTERGRVAIDPLLEALFERGINQLLVEGGAEVAGAFVDAGRVDQVRLFFAPKVFGGAAKAAIGGQGAARIAEALHLTAMQVEVVGEDLLLTAYAVRDARADVHGDRGRRGRGPKDRGGPGGR